MFKLDPSPTFPATVPISVPGGGRLSLKLTFHHKTASALAEYLVSAREKTNRQLLEEIVASVAETEKPVGMADIDFLENVIEQYPAAARDITISYLRELTESRAKN